GTGLVQTLAAIGLAWWLLAVESGGERYEDAATLLGSGWMKLPLVAVVFCFFYHLSNGIRHLVWDFGFGFDRRQIRASGWAGVAVAATVTVIYSSVAIVWGKRLGSRHAVESSIGARLRQGRR